jgi:hypothetical protein
LQSTAARSIRFHGAVRRKHDYRHFHVDLAELTQERDPVFARHFQVGDDKVAPLGTERSQRLVGARSWHAVETDLLGEDLENTPQPRVVVVDDEKTLHTGTCETGRLTWKTVPQPISLSTETRP